MPPRRDDDEIEDEEDYVPLSIPPEYRTINALDCKIPVSDLWRRFVKGDIAVEPDFQRHYVWDPTRASRYIESLLLRLPTPPVFVSEEPSGKWIVIDGHQRLETLFRFMKPLLAGPTAAAGGNGSQVGQLANLTLSKLEILPDLNGKTVTALTRDDRTKLWETEIGIVCLPADAHPDMRYALFARLNLGSMSLNSQELRNCLYRGPYNTLIASLSEGQRFLRLWGKNAPDKRMHDRELVLRFFAMLHRAERYRRPFRVFLNDEISENRDLSAFSGAECRNAMDLGMTWVERVFDKESFRLFRVGKPANPQGRWGTRRVDLVYELEMMGFAQFGDPLEQLWSAADLNERQLLRQRIRSRLIDVMTDERFVEAVYAGTTRPEYVELRIQLWTHAMNDIIEEGSETIDIAEELVDRLRRSTICDICPNPMTPDDAIWHPRAGGKQLVHRYCNMNA